MPVNQRNEVHFYSICESSYDAFFDNFISYLFASRSQYFLSRLADPNTMSVFVNGTMVMDWQYDAVSNSIIFDQSALPPPEARIQICYNTMCLY